MRVDTHRQVVWVIFYTAKERAFFHVFPVPALSIYPDCPTGWMTTENWNIPFPPQAPLGHGVLAQQ